MNNLKDKKVLLCVTGSIAAYKACEFIRLLKKQQCQVQVVMSKSSENFIGKLSLSALSDNIVLTEEGQTGLEHVKFAIDFDAIVILRCNPEILSQRNKARGWSEAKIKENEEKYAKSTQNPTIHEIRISLKNATKVRG